MNKKILMVLTRYKGGVGRVVTSVKPLLEKAGYDVEIISREDDLNCYSFKNSIRLLRKKIKSIDYDVLYSQDWSIALPLLDFKNHYVCFHGIEPAATFLQKFVYLIKQRKVIVVGNTLKEKYPKSKVIYNGVNFNEFYNLNKERQCVGWIKRDYETITEKDIIKYGKDNNLKVSIAENIKPSKMNEWYNSLSVFISYPKDYTGFNLCWLEAVAAGVPTVLGNNNGMGIKNIKKYYKTMTWENHVKKLLKVLK
jgi:glycosyltransferase involved in cell wall biosynthesis